MKRSLWQESFVPLMLIFLTIFVALLFVQYRVGQEADHAIVIEIPLGVDTANTDAQDINDNAEEDLDTASAANPERDEIFKLIAAHQWQEAEQLVQAKLSVAETSENLTYLGIIYSRQHKYKKAMTYLDRAVQVQPLYSSAYFYRGTVFSKLDDLEKAVADYQQQITVMPFHFEAHYNLGIALRKLHKYKTAIKIFERTLALAGGSRKAKTYYNMGLVYHDRGVGFEKQAKDAFEEAIRLQPNYISPRFGLAGLEAEDEAGQNRALLQYETVLRLRPDYAPAYFRIGLAYSALNNTKASISAYQKAVQLNPAYVKARYNLGLQYINAKKWSEATQQFMWILERKPDHDRSRFNLGRIYSGQSNYPAAIEQYNLAIELRHGDYPAAFVNKGLVLVEQNLMKQAMDAFDQALKLRPDYAQAWYAKGLAQLKMAKQAEAINALELAVKYKTDFAPAWLELGKLYAANGQLEAAGQAYNQVLQSDKQHQQAHLELAAIYEKQNRYSDAAVLYEAVLVQYPSYVVAWQKLGSVYMQLGKLTDAERLLRRALELDAESNDIKRLLAEVLVKLDRFAEAVGLLAQVVESEPAVAAFRLDYARALLATGDKTRAEAELEKGLLLAPEDEGLLQTMAELKKSKG